MNQEHEILSRAATDCKSALKAMIEANIAKMDEAETGGEIQRLNLLNMAIRSIGAVRFGPGWFSE